MLQDQKFSWLSSPTTDHLVQYYPFDKVLLNSLEEFVSSGLNKNETCIVLATENHIRKLDEKLQKTGIDVINEKITGHYRTIDANVVLESLLEEDGTLDLISAESTIRAVTKGALNSGRPVRVYGELVAELWKRDDLQAALEIEGIWNNLLKEYSFALYCAYPQICFDRDIHRGVLDEINHSHSLVTPTF